MGNFVFFHLLRHIILLVPSFVRAKVSISKHIYEDILQDLRSNEGTNNEVKGIDTNEGTKVQKSRAWVRTKFPLFEITKFDNT